MSIKDEAEARSYALDVFLLTQMMFDAVLFIILCSLLNPLVKLNMGMIEGIFFLLSMFLYKQGQSFI